MNYQNWQKAHKQAYESWKARPISRLTPEEIRIRAWNKLRQWCTPEELEKLFELAQRYQQGQLTS